MAETYWGIPKKCTLPLNMVNLAIVLCLPWNTGKVPVIAQYIGGTQGEGSASILAVCLGKQILGKEDPKRAGKERVMLTPPPP